jgi:hypothetical protein
MANDAAGVGETTPTPSSRMTLPTMSPTLGSGASSTVVVGAASTDFGANDTNVHFVTSALPCVRAGVSVREKR